MVGSPPSFDGVTVTSYVVPNGSAAAPELLAKIAAENDVAIVGLANCGSCTAWSFHDSAELFKAGLPVTWVATGEFEGLARSLALARRVPLPIVVLPKNPETIAMVEAIAMADDAFEAITSALVEVAPDSDGPDSRPDPVRELAVGAGQSAQDLLYERGLTDGLPVIVPGEPEVAAMRAGLADRDEIIGYVPPTYFPLTAETLAANAVSGGMRAPVHADTARRGAGDVRARVQPERDRDHHRTVDADGRRQRSGAWRDRSELRAGRARSRDEGERDDRPGAPPRHQQRRRRPRGTISKSIMGQPGRFTFCLGEDEEDSPWEPLAETLGLDHGASAATVLGATGTINILTPRRGAENMMTMLADGLANMGNPNVIMGKGTVAVIITSGHAAVLDGAGYSKGDVARAIWAEARIPLDRFPPDVRPDPPYEFIEVGGYVHAAPDPEHVYVIVAGGPEPTHATVVPTHPSCVPVTEPII